MKKTVLLRLPKSAAYVILLLLTVTASFWGTAEFFHEGWFTPYTQFIFYCIPMLLIGAVTILSIHYPVIAGLIITSAGIWFTWWRVTRLVALRDPITASVWIACLLIALPGLLLLADCALFRGKSAAGAERSRSTWGHWRELTTVLLPLAVIIAVGIPSLVRNLARRPLVGYGEAVVRAGGSVLVFAGRGPGWLYSNRQPVMFHGKGYAGLCWNQIALFGKQPLGFENKLYGTNNSTAGDCSASQDEFECYNMFRYINDRGDQLTDSLWDCWRLPTVSEYVTAFTRHGDNAGGTFDSSTGRSQYRLTPDKEAPLWAHDQEVIYYWTATSAGRDDVYDISYSGRTRPIPKHMRQDYRGFRAVRK